MIDLPAVLTSTHELEEACAYLGRQTFVTVDTEFLRQTTYRPKLCLIQMAGTG
ncbi:MAG: ribonuclease D, partial [Rhodomicrobium sp.]